MSVIVINKKKTSIMKLPLGSEIFFYNTEALLHSDWSIDTQFNGMFIMGALSGQATDTIAGADTHTHSITVNDIGNHTHTVTYGFGGTSYGGQKLHNSTESYAKNGHSHNMTSKTSSWGGSHGHTVSNTGTGSNNPPFRRLYLIEAIKETAVPIKGIILWNKALVNAPDGFVLCNGSNGTPDLRELFVRGAGIDSDIGLSGGATSHGHTVPNTTTNGAHDHTQPGGTTGGASSSVGGYKGIQDVSVQTVGHTHAVSSSTSNSQGGHSHTIASIPSKTVLPLYTYVYYLMRME